MFDLPPGVDRYVGTAEHLRDLIEGAGISQQEAARRLGINSKRMREYCSLHTRRAYPYTVQYAVEQLAYHITKKDTPCE